jgi:hypothetical protein
MSRHTRRVSYLTCAAGFSPAVCARFVLACDRVGFPRRVFHTSGFNALAGHIIHPRVADAIKPDVPNDARLWHVAAVRGRAPTKAWTSPG